MFRRIGFWFRKLPCEILGHHWALELFKKFPKMGVLNVFCWRCGAEKNLVYDEEVNNEYWRDAHL